MRKIVFQGIGSVPDATLEANRAYSLGLNLPSPKATAGKLAVVGGGESAMEAVSDLRQWDGEVWGINGAAAWCINLGIPATLFSISPSRYPQQYLANITRAVLSNECHPWLFDDLKRADVFTFDREGDGPTSACAIPALAVNAGFREISFFGCEGNYGALTHVYQDTPSPSDMIVRAGGDDYRTCIGYFMQTQVLAEYIRAIPAVFKDRSGGMLAAMVNDPDNWGVLQTPEELKAA